MGYLYWLQQRNSDLDVLTEEAMQREYVFDHIFCDLMKDTKYEGVTEVEPDSKRMGELKSIDRVIECAHPATYAYFIQVGTYSRREGADKVKAEMLLMGYEKVNIVKAGRAKSKLLYRIDVGPFFALSAAEASNKGIIKSGYKSLLKKYQNHNEP